MKRLKNPGIHLIISKSFTLVEVLMVCALLAFLMAIVVGAFHFSSARTAKASCISTIKSIETALGNYQLNEGYFIQYQTASVFYLDNPQSGKDFTDYLTDYEKMKKTSFEFDANSNRYYLVDPYGTAFRYRCPGVKNRMSFDLQSAGPDAIFDNEDDIKNWE